MRHLATWTLTAVSVFTIFTLAEKADVDAPPEPMPGIPYSPPPLPDPKPIDDMNGEYRGIQPGMEFIYSPYRLLNIDQPFYNQPAPVPISYDPKIIWLAQEIERLNRQRQGDEAKDTDNFLNKDIKGPESAEYNLGNEQIKSYYDYETSNDYAENGKDPAFDFKPKPEKKIEKDMKNLDLIKNAEKEMHQRLFALTPSYKDFYAPEPAYRYGPERGGLRFMVRHREDYLEETEGDFEDIRQPRQNPNKVKNLVEDPADIQPIVKHAEARARAHNYAHALASGAEVHQVHVHDEGQEPPASLYAVAIFTAMGAALSIAIIGIAFGWYTLSRKAKAAADVDYPAYGVTGPSGDASGERKLAQSAHMYHYQHQKQQIIAMERAGTEEKNGSVSDPESEEENEEGDYTVYECPGFATTGDMEVKNPLFSDEPTPATPATGVPANSPAIVVQDPNTE